MTYPAMGHGRAVAELYGEGEDRAGAYRTGGGGGGGHVLAALQALFALASLALLIGIAIWGTQQVMRDVTGVPVVRALEGPMRVAPENPGGMIAGHTGLAVNEVAGSGAAAAPAPQVRLAPDPVPLADEDLPQPLIAPRLAADPAPEHAPEDAPGDAPEPGDMLVSLPQDASPGERAVALADLLAADAEPLEGTAPEAEDETAQAAPLPDGPGLPRSLRPAPRPEGVDAAVQAALRSAAAAVAPAAAAEASAEVDPASLAPGTRLVQLGAHDSAEAARAAWTALAGRFDGVFDGKRPVLQQAEANGDAFWRLRAVGLADLSAARRFCAVLVAERADCIPVVAR